MKRVVLIWALGLLVFPGAQAQESTKKVLTFEEAIRIALRNGVLLNTQKNNLELNQMQKVGSIGAAAPNISVNSTAQQYNGNSFNNATGTVINGVRDGLSGSINTNLNLFSGFYRINSIRQYANLLEGQSYFVKRTAQDLMNTVATQYLQVMLDVELLRIGKENWDALQKQLLQIQGQVDLGARAPVDGYNQSALAKTAELTYVQAEVTLNNDKALLAQTLLMDPFEEFETEKPSWDVNTLGSETISAKELADQAKQYRGDYWRALKNEKGYKYATVAARGLMMPNLTAFYNYGSQYNRQHDVPTVVENYNTVQTIVVDPSAASGYSIQNTTVATPISNPEYPLPFKKQLQIQLYKQYGVQLNIPINNGFQNRVNYMTQKVLYENAIVTRQNVEFQIKNDAFRAVQLFDGAKKTYTITADKLVYAQKALELETQRYELGVTSFVEYTNANRVLIQAQTDKAQAEYKLVFQKIMLGYAAGTLKPEDVTSQNNN